MTLLIIGIGFFFFLILAAWRFQGEQPSTFGSAAWCQIWPLFKNGHLEPYGLRVGDWTGRLSIFYEDTHAITFGASGAGKGIGAILPNLLEAEHAFVIDPGGENTAVAAKSFRERGLAFGCINIFGMFGDAPWSLPAHGFNPLEFLDPASDTLAADAQVFAEMLTPRKGQEEGNTSYFKDSSARAKRAMLIHIKTAEPKGRQTLATLYEYISGDASAWEALLEAMKANPVCGGIVVQEANILERIEAQASEEFSAVMSTIQQDLSWLADPLVREKMSCSDVDFSTLKSGRGGIISVVLPLEYMESHAAIPRLALACAILEMQRLPIARDKVLFLIDEAAALGKILRFPNWLATMRKYGAVIWSIWQSAGQVIHLYDKNWQTIISNCGMVQFLGIGDPQTAKYAEELLGKCTIETISTNSKGEKNFSQGQRSLLMADELRRLSLTLQIVFIGNLPPILLAKTPYWRRPELAGLYYDNPYLGSASASPGLSDHIAAKMGDAYHGLVWWMAPHPTAALIMTCTFFGLCAMAMVF